MVVPLGAANRDPARYGAPALLDVTRRQSSSLSFGWGPHVCIGAALTRLEAEIVLRQVLRRWPGLRLLDGEPQWRGNPVYRGVVALPVQSRLAVDLPEVRQNRGYHCWK